MRSDIWSLGCVIYELACLKAPFEGTSLDDIYNRVKQCLPDHIPKNYSEKLQTVIMRLIRRDPHDRTTMGSLRSLDKLLALASVKRKSLDVFGDANMFADFGSESRLMRTIRLPRKEADISKIVDKAASMTRNQRSQQSLMSSSSLHQSESSMSNIKHSTRKRYVSSNDSKFSLASINSMAKLQPKIISLHRDLREHRRDLIVQAHGGSLFKDRLQIESKIKNYIGGYNISRHLHEDKQQSRARIDGSSHIDRKVLK